MLAVVFAAWDAGASWLGFSGRQSIPYLELVHTLYILSAILLLFVLASRDRTPLSRFWAAVDRASYLTYLYHCLAIVIFNDQVIRLNLSSVGTELVLRLLVVYPVTIGGALLWQWMMRKLRQHLTSSGRRVAPACKVLYPFCIIFLINYTALQRIAASPPLLRVIFPPKNGSRAESAQNPCAPRV